VLIGLLAGAAAPAPAAAEKPAAPPAPAVFDPLKVWQVHVTVSAEEFAAMQPRAARGFPGFGPAPKEPKADPKREVHRNNFGMDLPWAAGSVTIADESFERVALRYKGNGTIGDASRTVKKSFKIDLQKLGGKGRWGGSKTVNLHCGVADPSKLRESLGYEVYRAAGVPAPRTTLAEVRLTVPGKHDKELLGLYTVVEEVDKPFLRAHFGSDKGLLMKPEGLRDFEDKGDKWDAYKKQHAPKREATKEEAARLIAFARLVHKADDAAFGKEIASHLDVDGYLRFLAATAFLANTDSFFVLGHNYYLYLHPKTQRLHFLPWDLDRAFANFPILGSNVRQMDLSLAHPYGGTHRLTERLLAIPEVAARYRKLLKELAGTAFQKERLLKGLAAAEAAAKGPLEREAEAAAARKERGPGSLAFFGPPPALRRFVERRTASVAAQAAGTSKGYVPAAGFGPGGGKVGQILAGPMLESLDKDEDERLSREEWVGAARRLFAACEKDEDGRVDLKSLTAGLAKSLPAPPDGAPPGDGLAGVMAGPILARADADKDGKITSEEALAAAESLFDEFDKAKAGKLDEDAFGELLSALFPAPKGPPAPPKGKK
jgi:hypothetical protein